jgi:hypothetical protein
MSDEAALTPRQALQRKRARLLEELAELDRVAELAELAAKHNFVLVEAPSSGKTTAYAVASLVHCYRTDERSPYQRLRHKTRESYECLLRRLERDLGLEQIEKLDRERLERVHKEWTEASGVAMAHSLVTMLRGLASFGSTILKDRACRELRMLLHDMDFPMAKRSRTERLTREHVVAIRAKAHEMGRSSMALAQAFQFECMLRQKDVIGEWVPQNEPGPSSEVTDDDGRKWIRGLRWEEIDQNLFLRHIASISSKEVKIDLRRATMVLEELMLIYALDEAEVFDRSNFPSSGPVIICELTEAPWASHEFRRWWRKVADACDIPKNVRNMDSRPRTTGEGTVIHAGNGTKSSVQGPNETHEIPKADMEDLDLAHVSRH